MVLNGIKIVLNKYINKYGIKMILNDIKNIVLKQKYHIKKK